MSIEASTLTSHTAASADTWIERAARFGYAAKGTVYLLIGGLAAAAALGVGGQTTGSEGALANLLRQPFGRVLLGVVAAGLVGYAAWRLVQTFLDPEDKGTDFQGLVLRGYYFVSAVTHTFLAITAARMALGDGGSGGSSTESRTAELMSQPFGRWLVGIVGVAVIGGGIYQFIRGYKTKFEETMDLGRLGASGRRAVVNIGRAGLVSRAVVFAIIGGFFLVAAWQASPERAKGLGEALATVESQPYGPWLLAVVALGLFAYGVHQIVKSWLREIG